KLPSTLVFDYPTAAAVAKLLRSKLDAATAAGAASAVDAQIAALRAALAALGSAEDRNLLAERVRATLAEALAEPAPGPEPEPEPEPAADERSAVEAAASADELFALIDQISTRGK
ncbi:MAG: hypothetical protein HOQ24_01735, partial [Mycobacteriaceae bacterium]|nr:hypothetical protein [Mycobacteriaceae bacterium]